MKKENKVIKFFVNIGALAGFTILIVWIFQGLESSSSNPKTELMLSGSSLSKYNMISCITHVMSKSDELSEYVYNYNLKLCRKSHVQMEVVKDLVKDFSIYPTANIGVQLSKKLSKLQQDKKAVAEMLKEIKTKKEKKEKKG